MWQLMNTWISVILIWNSFVRTADSFTIFRSQLSQDICSRSAVCASDTLIRSFAWLFVTYLLTYFVGFERSLLVLTYEQTNIFKTNSHPVNLSITLQHRWPTCWLLSRQHSTGGRWDNDVRWFYECLLDIGIDNKKAVLSQRWPRDARYISRSWGVAEIWPFEIIQDAGAILNLFESKIAPLDPPSPKKPYPRTKHEVDRITRCRDMAIRVWWGHMKPQFLAGRGGCRGSAMAPLERAIVVSYRLSIVTVALSVTIQPQFAIECLRRSNRQGVGDFGPKFSGVPLGADPSCWGCKERTSQAN